MHVTYITITRHAIKIVSVTFFHHKIRSQKLDSRQIQILVIPIHMYVEVYLYMTQRCLFVSMSKESHKLMSTIQNFKLLWKARKQFQY